MTTLYDLSQILKHLPGKHSQASHASRKGGMPSRFAKEFGMDQEGYDKVSKSLGKDWGQNVLDAYEFKSSGLQTQLTRVELVSEQRRQLVEIEGDVHDKDGRKVGEFVRSIEHKYPIVTHVDFKLDKSVQGKGFGSAFYQHNEESYVAMGIVDIGLHANREVGGYAWARMGFDFSSERESASMYERFASSWYAKYDTEPPFVTTPWEIASAMGPDGAKIGRDVMVGSSWQAIKPLDPSSTGYKVGQVYYEARKKRREALKQARKQHIESDSNGFWSEDEADDEWLDMVRDLLE